MVSRHAKPLIIAVAPMVVVIDFRAIGQRLLCRLACGCSSANERKTYKSAPEQLQRKENGGVLTKESETLLWHRKNKTMPDPTKGDTQGIIPCACFW